MSMYSQQPSNLWRGPRGADFDPTDLSAMFEAYQRTQDPILTAELQDPVRAPAFQEWEPAAWHADAIGESVSGDFSHGIGLTDPHTAEPITDPVIAPNGLTYDRATLDEAVRFGTILPGLDRALHAEDLRRDVGMREHLDDADRDIDAWLEDPILLAPMSEPVVASDGRTYDAATLRTLFQQHEGRSPFTRARLEPVAYRHYALEEVLRQRRGDDALPDDRRQPRVHFAFERR